MTSATLPQSEYLTVAEVAAALGLCKQTVYRMCQTEQLAHIRTGATGKIYRIRRDALDAHLTPAPPREPAPTPSWAWQNGPAPVPSVPGQLPLVSHDDCPAGGCPATCVRPE